MTFSLWIVGGGLSFIGLIAAIVTPSMALATLSNAKKKVHFPVEGTQAEAT